MKITLAILAICSAALAIFFVLQSDLTLLTHPKGMIARGELKLLVHQVLLMLIVIVPTFILLFVTVWRCYSKKAKYQPDHSYGWLGELTLWMIPSVIVAAMGIVTWHATHQLDPYKPIESLKKPLTIQVVALDWKWLFIYPEQGIATVNFVQFPERTPIHFKLSADDSPMNSFWIPQLSGQIYSMTGMSTSLHMMADGIGEYTGRASEINGEGYADMTFIVKSITDADFKNWVETAKQSPLQLSKKVYGELARPSIKNPIVVYSNVEKDLYDTIVTKYMHPAKQ